MLTANHMQYGDSTCLTLVLTVYSLSFIILKIISASVTNWEIEAQSYDLPSVDILVKHAAGALV